MASLEHIQRLMAGRSGASPDDYQMSPNVMTYLNSIWHGKHPPSSMSARDLHELHTVAQCLDSLTDGNLAQLGDMLMQRLKALQQRQRDGHWHVAQNLELLQEDDVELTTKDESKVATEAEHKANKLSESIAKAAASKKKS